jgi:serine/threonine protein kinase
VSIHSEKASEGQLLKPGATLSNRYLIQESIGIGGMGAVYRARDLHFPNVVKLVAVKEMVNRAHDPIVRETIIKNFEREANILATLSHPAIPRIFDYFTQEERSYLILEFILGKNLEFILSESRGFMPQDKVIQWGIELCDVLEYLHSHQPEPIIFRDMKPSNVMINQHHHIVLVDFGIAKNFQSGEKGTMIGTEGYSPPEQYRGEASSKADIYALGATLHHLLTRRDPRLEAPFSFAERPIRQINPDVLPELASVIELALQYNPEDRLQSAQAMKEALLDVARQTGTIYLAPTRDHVQTAIEKVTPLWTHSCEDEIRGTATFERGVVYVGSYDHCVYAFNAKTGNLNWKYTSDAGVVSRPAVSGDVVCFGSEDHRLHVISARSGSIQWTYFTRGPIRSSPRIAHGHIFFGSDDSGLHAVNLSTGRGVWVTDLGAPVRSTPLISNEAIYVGNETGDFYCLDFRGNIKWRHKTKRAVTSSPESADNLVLFSSLDSHLYALDAKSGWLTWRFRMGKGSISTPCVVDNRVFVGSVDGNIYCVDLRTAKEIWRYQAEHQVTSSPVVYGESLFCGSVDGNLYCVDFQTGLLRWKFSTKDPITATPIIHDDVVFIGSTDHTFYALPCSG